MQTILAENQTDVSQAMQRVVDAFPMLVEPELAEAQPDPHCG